MLGIYIGPLKTTEGDCLFCLIATLFTYLSLIKVHWQNSSSAKHHLEWTELGGQEKQNGSSKIIEPGAVSFIVTPSVSW